MDEFGLAAATDASGHDVPVVSFTAHHDSAAARTVLAALHNSAGAVPIIIPTALDPALDIVSAIVLNAARADINALSLSCDRSTK